MHAASTYSIPTVGQFLIAEMSAYRRRGVRLRSLIRTEDYRGDIQMKLDRTVAVPAPIVPLCWWCDLSRFARAVQVVAGTSGVDRRKMSSDLKRTVDNGHLERLWQNGAD